MTRTNDWTKQGRSMADGLHAALVEQFTEAGVDLGRLVGQFAGEIQKPDAMPFVQSQPKHIQDLILRAAFYGMVLLQLDINTKLLNELSDEADSN